MGALSKVGVADVLTVSNGACGILAIWSLLVSGRDITLGSALVLLGFVFDGADGWAARRWGTKHDHGRHLDSVSDGITFCAAPAVMTWVVFAGAVDGAAYDGLVLLTAVLVAGLGWARLYRFTTRGYLLEHFLGLATPATAFLAIMACHILNPDRWESGAVPVAAVIILLVAALLMVAPVRYPKVRGRTAAILAAAVVAALVIIGVMRERDVPGTDDAFRALAVGGLALVAAYVLLGPVWMITRTRSD